jgi:hypothetical protein
MRGSRSYVLQFMVVRGITSVTHTQTGMFGHNIHAPYCGLFRHVLVITDLLIPCVQILGAKTPVTSIISLVLCPIFRICQLCCHWMDFLEIVYWRCLLNCAHKFQVWLESDTNIGHFTWRPKYVLCWLTAAFAFPWLDFNFVYIENNTWSSSVQRVTSLLHCDNRSGYVNPPEVFRFVDVFYLVKLLSKIRGFGYFCMFSENNCEWLEVYWTQNIYRSQLSVPNIFLSRCFFFSVGRSVHHHAIQIN